MKISIIMVDGGFREKTFGEHCFCRQDFPSEQYEVLWVDYYDKINVEVASNPKIKTIALNKTGIYHSSYCFNRGITEAKGTLLVIPDADQIVQPDFLHRVWKLHKNYEKLVVYGYRFDEIREGSLTTYDFEEIKENCIIKNAFNYGGCLTIQKKWLIEMNGYEQHEIFRTGYHANGLLMYSRFKNMGLAVQWEPSLRLYHPWHPFTLTASHEYDSQHKVIQWVQKNLFWKTVAGIDSLKNQRPPVSLQTILDQELTRLDQAIMKRWGSLIKR